MSLTQPDEGARDGKDQLPRRRTKVFAAGAIPGVDNPGQHRRPHQRTARLCTEAALTAPTGNWEASRYRNHVGRLASRGCAVTGHAGGGRRSRIDPVVKWGTRCSS